ncbi:MAG: CoA transferase subunit A [Thermodesulfobacteriota bacterium]
MKNSPDKTMGLEEAVSIYVQDGFHLSIGGFTVTRNPMALIREIVRQKIGGLHLSVHSNGQGLDELVGGGGVSRIELAYGANGRFAPTCVRFKKEVQDGRIMVEDYTNYQMNLRFLAGSMGIPFLPTRSSLGTDIIDKWGFPEAIRKNDPGLPDRKLVVQDNPFPGWTDAGKVVLVPALNPDASLIHVQKADKQGNCRIQGLTFCDVEQAKAARRLIVSCEELVESEELRQEPEQNQIPFLHVDAVVHLPFGAWPTACPGCYDYDPQYLMEYLKQAKDERLYAENREYYVYGPKSHQDLLDLLGPDRLHTIKADPITGYATGLKRDV